MNTATGYTRVNLTIPKDIIAYLKRHTANMSSYISEAVRERIAREKREKALREILAAKATFTHVKDGTTYSLFHMTLHSYLSHTPRIIIIEFATTILPPRHPPYPLASNGLLRSAHQQWRPGTSLG